MLDFGLAKTVEPVAPIGGDATASPTIISPAMTQMGLILGSAAYMSPEQAKGHPADKRSDVWSFGAVLHEMLSGQRTFKGADIADTLAAVLRQDVDWTALPAPTPASVRYLLARCLERDVTNSAPWARRGYDIMPNGQFVGLIPVGQAEAVATVPPILFVLNWHDELKRLAPTK